MSKTSKALSDFIKISIEILSDLQKTLNFLMFFSNILTILIKVVRLGKLSEERLRQALDTMDRERTILTPNARLMVE